MSDRYPEKVLATTERFYSYHPEEYQALIRVLQEACAFCDEPGQRTEMLNILSKPAYLNCSPRTLNHAFSGAFPMGYGAVSTTPFVRFTGEGVNRPDAKSINLIGQDIERYLPKDSVKALSKNLLSRVYRASIYDQAIRAVVS